MGKIKKSTIEFLAIFIDNPFNLHLKLTLTLLYVSKKKNKINLNKTGMRTKINWVYTSIKYSG